MTETEGQVGSVYRTFLTSLRSELSEAPDNGYLAAMQEGTASLDSFDLWKLVPRPVSEPISQDNPTSALWYQLCAAAPAIMGLTQTEALGLDSQVPTPCGTGRQRLPGGCSC